MEGNTPPTMVRLDDQIAWYDRKSRRAQRWFKGLKIVQLATAGLIPLVTVFSVPAPEKVAAVLGLVILVVEGLQQLNQYHANWIGYRSTCEALKHEKYLFLAQSGPYAHSQEATGVLADRIEGLISQEHAKWVSAQKTLEQKEADGGQN